MTRGEMRLRVMHSLSERQQDYVFGIVRNRCEEYLAKTRLDITPNELLSQLWEKLVRGASLVGGEQGTGLSALLSRSDWDERDPRRDRRVIWLLNELDGICTTQALRNLCVDIHRQRQGGKNPPPAIPIDCSEAEREEGIQQRPNQESQIHERDIHFAWKGLLALRTSECDNSEDDVLLLLLVLAENPEIEGGFTGQWPIKAIVVLLNARDRKRSWTSRNVDNIKEKLARWIAKKKQGFNHFEDFLAFLAGVGRKLESGKGTGDGYRDASRDRSLH